ncbi:MAG: SWIM zinc finger family protein [Polyangiaceae bacterium]
MRADLYALGPEAITSLANAGLVKRAQREIAEGKGPVLDEGEDGVVTGACPDGANVRWPPSTSLRDASCSCGAAQACRHRVAVALAYRAWVKGKTEDAAPPTPPADGILVAAEDVAPPSSRFEAWSPADIADDALVEHLGARTVEAARAVRARGVIARVRAGSLADPIPSAALPSCTVRFLVPRAITFARCDCQVAEACVHVALAVWAFRTAGEELAPGAEVTVELATTKATIDADAIEPLRALARWLFSAGVASVATSDAFAQRAALARAPLEARGYTWMLSLLEDLESLVDAYRRRAASYRADRALEIVSEIEARARSASASPHELPPSFVVGRDTPLETRLDHVRLTSLGAHVTVESDGTFVRLLLANPETGDVLALDKDFPLEKPEPGIRSAPAPAPLDALAAGARRVGGAAIAAIATGHVVTRAAVRRANDALLLRTSVKGATSVTPQNGDFSILASPRRADSADALRAHLAGRAPALLRPRKLGENVFVVPVTGVEQAAFDAAEQAVFATLSTPSGTILLVRHHKRGADRSLDAVAAALGGKLGALRWVAGEVDVEHGFLRIDPTMIVADRVIVPDFEPDPPPLQLPLMGLPRATSGARAARAELLERLVEIAHTGVGGLPPTFPERLRRTAERAAGEGWKGLAARGRALATALEAHSDDAFARWCDAAIRVELAAG